MSRLFNGTSDFGSFEGFEAPGDFSVSGWTQRTGGGDNDQRTAFAMDIFPATPRHALVWKPHRGDFEAHINGTGGVLDSTIQATGVWHHWAMVRSGTTVTCYIAGASVGTITVGSGTFNARNPRVGCHFFNGGNGEFFLGRVAELCFWRGVALTADEIAALAKGAFAGQIRPKSVLFYYPIPGFSSPEPDSSGKGFPAMILTGSSLADHAPVGGQGGVMADDLAPNLRLSQSGLEVFVESSGGAVRVTQSGMEVFVVLPGNTQPVTSIVT